MIGNRHVAPTQSVSAYLRQSLAALAPVRARNRSRTHRLPGARRNRSGRRITRHPFRRHPGSASLFVRNPPHTPLTHPPLTKAPALPNRTRVKAYPPHADLTFRGQLRFEPAPTPRRDRIKPRVATRLPS